MSTKRKVSTPSVPAPAPLQPCAADKESRVARWAQAWSDQFRREMVTSPSIDSAPPKSSRRRVKATVC